MMLKTGKAFSGILLFFLCSAVTWAADSFEGAYQIVRPAQPTHSEGRIEVLEVFWYGCPHCYTLEPYMEKWLADKPDDVDFRRMPGLLNSSWVAHARAFFTAEKMGVVNRIHEPLFRAIHRDKKRVFNEDELRDFMIGTGGVDGNEFTRIFNSKEIDIKMRQALVSQQKYQLDGVPAIIVNGKYYTNGTMAKSYENIIKVIEYLVDKERQETQ